MSKPIRPQTQTHKTFLSPHKKRRTHFITMMCRAMFNQPHYMLTKVAMQISLQLCAQCLTKTNLGVALNILKLNLVRDPVF